MKKIVPAIFLLLFATGCGLEGTAINEVGLVYEGGLIQDKNYRGILRPGATSESVGFGSTVARYPIDQRVLIAGPGNNADVAPVEIVTGDGVRMLVEYQLYFTLNQEEDVLRSFHENIGVKTNASTPEGWDHMLLTYPAPQVERSLEDAALKVANHRDLMGNDEVRTSFEGTTVEGFKRAMVEVIGGDYFCGPEYGGPGTPCGDFTLAIGRPTPVNPGILEAIEGEKIAVQRTAQQEQENLRVQKALEAERQQVALYGPQGALLRQAIAEGKVQLMVVPDGQGVSVPAPAP